MLITKPVPRDITPHHELATALRLRVDRILDGWERQLRQELPRLAEQLDVQDLRQHLTDILTGLAALVECPLSSRSEALAGKGPAYGRKHCRAQLDVRELLTAQRLLRGVIFDQTGSALRRAMESAEILALNDAIDAVMHEGTAAFFDCQQEKLRAASTELKYLSFLSHDLNNNLNTVTLWIQALQTQLGRSPDFALELEMAAQLEQGIAETVHGMRQFLEHERLRRAGIEPEVQRVELAPLAAGIVKQILPQASGKGLSIKLEIDPEAVVWSDPDLLRMILRNLIGNAVKHTSGGTVRLRALQRHDGQTGDWVLEVQDEGPGISPKLLEHVFDADDNPSHGGQSAVGLGLLIVSQAANLLKADLSVQSELGVGSVFRVQLPRKIHPAATLEGSVNAAGN